VADRADAVLGFGDGNALAAGGALLVGGEHARVDGGDDGRTLGAEGVERLLELGVFGLRLLAVGVDRPLLGRELRVRGP
jgi:hypothetical protein